MMDAKEFDNMTEEDLAKNFDMINPELEKKLTERDKTFMKVNRAVALIESINSIDLKMHNLGQLARKAFPDADHDTLKIITTRIDDLDSKKIEVMTLGFIKNLLTVEGKEYTMVIPEEIKRRFKGIDFNEIPVIDQMRTMLLTIKSSSEDIAKCNQWKEKLQNIFNTKVDDNIKSIISTPDNIEKYTMNYYQERLDDENTPEEEKMNIKKTIEYTEHAYNLKPLIDNLETQIKRQNGDVKSLMYGYRNNAKDTFIAANKILSANRLTFPIGALSNIEEALFGDTYKDYRFLVVYLLARWIKYRNNDINSFDRVFISQLISNIVRISRAKTEEDQKHCAMIIDKMKPNVEKLLRLIIDRI